MGAWVVAGPAGELVGPYVLKTSVHAFHVRGEGATFAEAFNDADALAANFYVLPAPLSAEAAQ